MFIIATMRFERVVKDILRYLPRQSSYGRTSGRGEKTQGSAASPSTLHSCRVRQSHPHCDHLVRLVADSSRTQKSRSDCQNRISVPRGLRVLRAHKCRFSFSTK
jgi:hypothetical protein